MAIAWVIILVAIIVTLYIFGKTQWMISIIAVFFCMQLEIPTAWMSIGGHYLLTLVLLVIVMVERRKGELYLSRPTLYFALAWGVVLLIYIAAYIINGNKALWLVADIKFLGLIMYVLETVLLITLVQTLDKQAKIKSLVRFVLILAAINTVFVLLQIYWNEIGTPLTKMLVSSKSLDRNLAHGFFTRAHGIYGSPVVMGGITLFSLAVFAALAIKKEKMPVYYTIIACIIGFIGLLSYTKTAVLGYPALLIVAVVCLLFQRKQPMRWRWKRAGAFVLCAVVMFGMWYLLTPERNQKNRDVYLRYLGGGIGDTFDTRVDVLFKDMDIKTYEEEFGVDLGEEFDNGDNLVKSTFTIVKENWLMGVGPVSVQGEHVYDMQFITILHNGGVIALLVLGVLYVWLGIHAIRKNNIMVLLILVVALILCTAMEVLLLTLYLPFMAVALCLSQDDKKIYLKKQTEREHL